MEKSLANFPETTFPHRLDKLTQDTWSLFFGIRRSLTARS